MNEDYGIAPLSHFTPQSLTDQLLEILAMVQEYHEPWLRNEAESMGIGDLSRAAMLLNMSPPEAVAKKFQRLNPELDCRKLHLVNPVTVALGVLRVFSHS